MLEKLTTHDIQDVSALFSLTDKYAKAVEGRAWHSPVTQALKGESKPNARIRAQGGDNGNNNNKKKKVDGNQSLVGAPTAAAAAAGGGQEATNAPVSYPIATTAAQSYCRAWGPGPSTTELTLARLGLCTPRASLCRGRCPRKDRPDRG
jgi:hypothetical protein